MSTCTLWGTVWEKCGSTLVSQEYGAKVSKEEGHYVAQADGRTGVGETPREALAALWGPHVRESGTAIYYPQPVKNGIVEYRAEVPTTSGPILKTSEGWVTKLGPVEGYTDLRLALRAMRLHCWGADWVQSGLVWKHSTQEGFTLAVFPNGTYRATVDNRTATGKTPEEAIEALLGPPIRPYGLPYYPSAGNPRVYTTEGPGPRWISCTMEQWQCMGFSDVSDTPEEAIRFWGIGLAQAGQRELQMALHKCNLARELSKWIAEFE